VKEVREVADVREKKSAGLQHAADQPAGTTSVVQKVVDAYNAEV